MHKYAQRFDRFKKCVIIIIIYGGLAIIFQGFYL